MAARAEGDPPPGGLHQDPVGRAPEAVAFGRRLLVVVEGSARRTRVLETLGRLEQPIDVSDNLEEAVRSIRRTMPDLIVLAVNPEGGRLQAAVATLRSEASHVGVLLWPPEEDMADDPVGGGPHEILQDMDRSAAAPTRPPASERRHDSPRIEFDPFLGESDEIRDLAARARAALASESPILIEGETGTGKGVLAAWLHRNGVRSQRPFVDLNSAGFSRELMDSELFGHGRGAFTGAFTAKPGLLDVADGGTLFLDEIGDMDEPIQAKLLKVIEEKRFRRIGETRERQANVRIIAATHHDLSRLVRDGRFREDLYYRIRVLSLSIPALRHRVADLGILVRVIARSVARDLGRENPKISGAVLRNLASRPWPGNLRELRNTLERAMLAAGDGAILPKHLGVEDPVRRAAEPAGGTLLEIERAYIERVLAEEQNVTQAARRLGMARSTLYQKLQQLGLHRRS